jgi:hypothetical protein
MSIYDFADEEHRLDASSRRHAWRLFQKRGGRHFGLFPSWRRACDRLRDVFPVYAQAKKYHTLSVNRPKHGIVNSRPRKGLVIRKKMGMYPLN